MRDCLWLLMWALLLGCSEWSQYNTRQVSPPHSNVVTGSSVIMLSDSPSGLAAPWNIALCPEHASIAANSGLAVVVDVGFAAGLFRVESTAHLPGEASVQMVLRFYELFMAEPYT
jgi:hypothetical protein